MRLARPRCSSRCLRSPRLNRGPEHEQYYDEGGDQRRVHRTSAMVASPDRAPQRRRRRVQPSPPRLASSAATAVRRRPCTPRYRRGRCPVVVFAPGPAPRRRRAARRRPRSSEVASVERVGTSRPWRHRGHGGFWIVPLVAVRVVGVASSLVVDVLDAEERPGRCTTAPAVATNITMVRRPARDWSGAWTWRLSTTLGGSVDHGSARSSAGAGRRVRTGPNVVVP